MSAQEMRAFVLQLSQRGLMIRHLLELMHQVMDRVQVQQLLLLLQADCMEMEEGSGGAGVLDIETLVKDQSEVHEFEGNTHDD